MTPRQRNLQYDTIVDANLGYPELKKRDPELWAKVTGRQRAVAEARRRSAAKAASDTRRIR